jgi:hypothetical protein
LLRSANRPLFRAKLPLGALRAEHGQVVVDVEVHTPLLGRVLVLTRLPSALGTDEISDSGQVTRLVAAMCGA